MTEAMNYGLFWKQTTKKMKTQKTKQENKRIVSVLTQTVTVDVEYESHYEIKQSFHDWKY